MDNSNNNPPLLLKAADIAAMPGDKRVHFLNPNAVRNNKFLGDAVGLTQIGVHIIRVKPGHDTTEYHKYYYEEECVYILSGQATAIINRERHAVGPGDFLGFPRGVAAHNIVNDGDEILQYSFCLAPAAHSQQKGTQQMILSFIFAYPVKKITANTAVIGPKRWLT